MTEPVDPGETLEASSSVKARLQEAISFHQAGNLAEAERLYRTVLRTEPEHGETLRLLGVTHLQRKNAPLALELFDRALLGNRANVALHDNRGHALTDLGRHEEAFQAYDAASRLAPRADLFNNRGNALRALGRYAEALASYNTALLHRPDYVDAMCQRGVCLNLLGLHAEAEAWVTRALLFRPEHQKAVDAQRALLSSREAQRTLLSSREERCDGSHRILSAPNGNSATTDAPASSRANMLETVEFVTATRFSVVDFWQKSALGLSFRRMALDTQILPRITFENDKGLPEIYNARLMDPHGPDLLVFVHDDVWLDDHFAAQRVVEGLKEYEVLGVAGSRQRAPRQAKWFSIDRGSKQTDQECLSGSIAHGQGPFGSVSKFGPTPTACELLDGVFLAVKKSSLSACAVRFDPRFAFHFYDMDLCRAARQKGLRLGTWPISITHQSEGAYQSQAWADGCRAYLDKWQE